jgi:hypothetical protein
MQRDRAPGRDGRAVGDGRAGEGAAARRAGAQPQGLPRRRHHQGHARGVAKYTSWIYYTWQTAKNTGQCLSMSMTYTGRVTSIRPYRCNW